MTAIALRMTSADFLKLRRRRWLVILSLFLTLGILVIVYAVTVIQHSSDPAKYGPAGGASNFSDGLRVLSLLFGPLAAILIGVAEVLNFPAGDAALITIGLGAGATVAMRARPSALAPLAALAIFARRALEVARRQGAGRMFVGA